MLPFYFCYDYEVITRYAIFRWNLGSSFGDILPFHEIVIPERQRILQKECCKYARQIKSTQYVWDFMTFQRMVSGTQYCSKVNLIKDEDVVLIKNALLELVDDLELLAIKGKHTETGNEVSIYISDANLDTNFSLIKSQYQQLTLIKTFILNACIAMDEVVYKEAYAWLQAMRRMSTLISVSGEKVRASYFNAQRDLINTL
jgi:hypothetical protein